SPDPARDPVRRRPTDFRLFRPFNPGFILTASPAIAPTEPDFRLFRLFNPGFIPCEGLESSLDRSLGRTRIGLTMRQIALLALLLPAAALPVCAAAQTPAATSPASAYPLAEQRAKIAPITITPDVSFLSAEERQVVNLLNEAADLM